MLLTRLNQNSKFVQHQSPKSSSPFPQLGSLYFMSANNFTNLRLCNLIGALVKTLWRYVVVIKPTQCPVCVNALINLAVAGFRDLG